MTSFRFLQDGGHLPSWIFLKVDNFNFQYGSEGQYAPSCQISCRSVNPLPRYGHFSIFQDGGRPPYWICYRHVGTTHEEYPVISVTVQNLVGIDAVVSTMWIFYNLSV